MTSVTLGPPAIISFNLKTPSTTLDGILKHKTFRVHMLTANRDGAEVAHSFIKYKHEEAFDHLHKHSRAIRFSGRKDEIPPPTVHGPGIRGHLICTLIREKCVEVGDHMVVIARVDAIHPRDYQKLPGSMGCLLYSDQKYRRHGEALILQDRSSPVRLAKSEGSLAAIRFIGDNEPELSRRLAVLLKEEDDVPKDQANSSQANIESLDEKDLPPETDDALDNVLRYIQVAKGDLVRRIDSTLKARAARRGEGGEDEGFAVSQGAGDASNASPVDNQSLEETIVNKLVELIERSPEEWAERTTATKESEVKDDKGEKPWWHI
jgi:flavin reductase (DIM6/NTAB) family NADH-FMN oxidoreductase RutF